MSNSNSPFSYGESSGPAPTRIGLSLPFLHPTRMGEWAEPTIKALMWSGLVSSTRTKIEDAHSTCAALGGHGRFLGLFARVARLGLDAHRET
jgi:hypothetical protein